MSNTLKYSSGKETNKQTNKKNPAAVINANTPFIKTNMTVADNVCY